MIEISSIISGMWLAYDHLCDILHISPTNDFYEISVPVTLRYMRGVYLQYPKDIVLKYVIHIPLCRYKNVTHIEV